MVMCRGMLWFNNSMYCSIWNRSKTSIVVVHITTSMKRILTYSTYICRMFHYLCVHSTVFSPERLLQKGAVGQSSGSRGIETYPH